MPRVPLGAIASVIAFAGSCGGGCQRYYRVDDPATGRSYYTDRWVAADGYSGPLTFTDRSGRIVSVRQSRVTRLSADEYHELTDASDPPASPGNAR